MIPRPQVSQASPPWTGRTRPRRWGQAAALASLLALAAVLRFGSLGWGLRHEPHIDERYFVENVGWMLAHRDIDHRFDEYPGLFFYALTPVRPKKRERLAIVGGLEPTTRLRA